MARIFTLNTGAKIPSVGLGTWQADPGVVGEAVTAAIKAGYRHIDCARIYNNEKEIGMAFKKLFDEGVVKREDLFITSKLWCSDQAPEDVPVAMDLTLNELQLDYVDLYLIHCPFRVKKGSSIKPANFVSPDIPGTWGAMEKLYHAGAPCCQSGGMPPWLATDQAAHILPNEGHSPLCIFPTGLAWFNMDGWQCSYKPNCECGRRETGKISCTSCFTLGSSNGS